MTTPIAFPRSRRRRAARRSRWRPSSRRSGPRRRRSTNTTRPRRSRVPRSGATVTGVVRGDDQRRDHGQQLEIAGRRCGVGGGSERTLRCRVDAHTASTRACADPSTDTGRGLGRSSAYGARERCRAGLAALQRHAAPRRRRCLRWHLADPRARRLDHHGRAHNRPTSGTRRPPYTPPDTKRPRRSRPCTGGRRAPHVSAAARIRPRRHGPAPPWSPTTSSEPPTRSSSRPNGTEEIDLGTRTFRRDGPTQAWTAQRTDAADRVAVALLPPVLGRGVSRARVVGTGVVDGVASTIVAFVRPDLPAWFRIWVGTDGIVRREEMLAEGHLMVHTYSAFDHAPPIPRRRCDHDRRVTPPSYLSVRSHSTTFDLQERTHDGPHHWGAPPATTSPKPRAGSAPACSWPSAALTLGVAPGLGRPSVGSGPASLHAPELRAVEPDSRAEGGAPARPPPRSRR